MENLRSWDEHTLHDMLLRFGSYLHPYPIGLRGHVARPRIAVHGRRRPRRGTAVVVARRVSVGGLELALELPDGAVLVLALLLQEDDLPLEVRHLVEAGRILPGELQLFG